MTIKVNRIALKKYKGVYYRESTSNKWRGKPDKCYWILFTDARTGKKRWEKCGWLSEGWTPEAAQAKRAEMLEKDRAGEYKTKQERERAKLTFRNLAVKYIEWAKTNKKSWKDDERRYKTHIDPVIGKLQLEAITPFILEKLKRDLSKKTRKPKKNTTTEKKLSPATIKHCLVLVRQMFNKAIAWGFYNGNNPIKQVKLPSLDNRRVKFLTYDQAEALLKELNIISPFTHDQAILSLYCGLRFSEIAKLTVSDIDFRHNIIHIKDPKGSSREAYITENVRKILQVMVAKTAQPTDLIFPDKKGGLQKSVSNSFEKAVNILGFNKGITDRRNKVVFHTLRHTFASWLAIQGTPLYTIKELMGHKTLAMTERYAHLIPDHKREAVEQMSKMIQAS